MTISEHGRGDGSVRETHVSVLLFFDDVVLKYKKPLRLPFVDFTRRDERRRACQDEVAYNRRLSPDVYLGVADVALGGRSLDHAVVMRRLPDERSLARMAVGPQPLRHEDLERLARLLADFHATSERSAAIDDDARVGAVARLWRNCLDTLSPYGGELVETETLRRIDELSAAYLAGRAPLFEERVAQRRVCDGHGDLLASDVFLLDDGPRVLDCIEFDPRLRHIDVIADVAFLVMDLEHLGAGQAATDFLRLYCEAAGDVVPSTLVHHYCAERAVVRAEVACLRAEQAPGEGRDLLAAEAASLLDLALAHLLAGRVVLGVVCGLPGTGKSTVAAAAAEALRWPVWRSDEIRREVVGHTGGGPLEGPYRLGAYTADVTERTYATMLERARVALEHGQSVIVDATFTDATFQRRAEELARATASEIAVVQCTAADEVARARMRARRASGADVSGADEDVARAMAAAAERWPRAVAVDTGGPAGACLEEVLAVLSGPRQGGPDVVPV